jgi:uncharacterized protein (TIGR00369 family)
MERPEDHKHSPFLDMVGVELEAIGDGHVRYSLKLEEKHTNPNGVMHGGVLTSMMDEAAGHAIVTVRGIEIMATAPHATVEMNVSFISGARPGDEIVVESRVLKVGRSVAFAEAEARRRGNNDLIAKGRFTFVIQAARGG